MRKALLAGCVLAASACLAACGGGSTATTLKQFVASFGSQQYSQITLTATFTGAGSTTVGPILGQFSIVVNAENPTGAPLSEANGNANVQILVNHGTTTLADLREVGSSLYFKVDVAGLASVPGLHISPSELAVVQLVIGGRWFEVPKSLIESVLPRASAQQVAQTRAIEAKVIDALAKYIDASHYVKTSNGFSESGSIQKLESSLAPTFASI
ncbi:MAG TPA: hypothetical protein VEJ44_07405, partial [Acidimicrobiales bacterium]|nr:hypothetical protein [Acidimicrobiales bacterium]